jgi:hypothetical protein
MSAETEKMKIGDFVKECELFPYSKENFDLIKEASELYLMEQYIESHRFRLENSEMIEEYEGFLTEGFLFEFVDKKQINPLKEQFSEKSKSFGNKIKALWDKIVRVIKAAFSALLRQCLNLKGKTEEIRKYLGVNKLDPQVHTVIQKMVEDAIKTSGAPISEKQIEGFSKLPRAIVTVGSQSTRNRLAAVLVNNSIQVTVSSERFPNALSEKQLKELLTGNAGRMKPADIESKITGFKNKNYQNGLMLSKKDEDARSLVDGLKTFEGFLQKDETDAKISGDWNTNMQKSLNLLYQVTGDTIKLYNAVTRFCGMVILGLYRIIGPDKARAER